MEIDKDLLIRNNKIYSPETCCILPKTLNMLISGCHKHQDSDIYLPLGVNRIITKERTKFRGVIGLDGKIQLLPLRNTPMQAFNDYLLQKNAQLMRMAEQYKQYLPEHIYKALASYEVYPFTQTTYCV